MSLDLLLPWVLLAGHFVVISLAGYRYFVKKNMITSDLYLVFLAQALLKIVGKPILLTNIQIYLFIPLGILYIYFTFIMLGGFYKRSRELA